MSSETDKKEVAMPMCPICDAPISRWIQENWNVLRSKLHPLAYLELCRYASSEGLPHPNEQAIICGHCFIELSFGIANWNPTNFASDDVVTIKTVTPKEKRVTWIGTEPVICEICGQLFASIDNKFIDGRLKESGKWGKMCTGCHVHSGAGLGLGCGRLYVKQGDEWVDQAYQQKEKQS